MCQTHIIKQPHLEIAMNIYQFLSDVKDQILPIQYRHALGILEKVEKLLEELKQAWKGCW